MATKNKNTSPENLKARLLEFHNKKVVESENVLMENATVPCFDYVINMSGGELMITDLRAVDKNPDSPKVYPVSAGKRFNFNSIFPIGAINRNRDQLLRLFTEMRSEIDPDYPAMLLVSQADLMVEFPFQLVKTSLVDKLKAKGQGTLELGRNEYDERLAEELAKEKKANEKASVTSGIGNLNTKTKQEVEASI
jgi:hypothetical protein